MSWHRSKLGTGISLSTPTVNSWGNHALHILAERVYRVCSRLAASLLVALDGAKVCVLYDDAIERALEARRGRVPVGGQQEAASTRVPGTDVRWRTEGKLVHRRCEAVGRYATRCWGYGTQRMRSRGVQLAMLTRTVAPRVKREGRSTRGELHVPVRGSGLGFDHNTVYCGGEKRDRGEES